MTTKSPKLLTRLFGHQDKASLHNCTLLYTEDKKHPNRVQPRNSEMCDSISVALSKPRRPLTPIANESFRLKINDFEKKLLIDGPVTVIQ